MTDTSSLRAFIEARLAEDEASRWPHRLDCQMVTRNPGWSCNCDAADRWHREVAAKRARIELAEQIGAERGHPFWPYAGEQLLKLEAASWSDHPDFRTEWSTA
jgi:hypothetical protein